MAELTYSERLVVTSCWCGIKLAIPSELESYARRHKDKSVYCPLGHKFVYFNSIEEQLEKARAERDAEKRRTQAARDLLHAEERSHTATRGHLTRARKRAKEGVCPCCKRTFANVASHVASKHPDFKPEAHPA